MSLPLAFALALLGADTFVISPRIGAVAIVLTPGQSDAKSDTSGVLTSFSRAIEPRTDLRVASPEQLGLDVGRLLACPPDQRLTCWTREISALGPAPPRYLFVLSVSRGEATLISGLMLDVAAAALLRGGPEEIEGAIYEATARTKAVPAGAIEQLVDQELRPALERAGRWGRLGSIELALPCDGCVIELDDATLGAAARGPVIIDRISPGQHTIVVREGPRVAWARTIEIEAGVETKLEVVLGEGVSSHDVLFWSGAGTSATGGVVGAVGLAAIAGRGAYACVARTAEESARCASPTHDGAALLGVGAGLAVAGVAWLSAAVLDEDEVLPAWLPFAVGAALGALGGLAIATAAP